eukprot:TRINITY_DN24795_c0_g1_i1.p1 TRINITY_DN24795_c0_g1~~TRINITY_DN24795_c0_g1_i1.p1  ORF type:complete len:118 (-),score=6.72 TRINITY_DN24795_c0_g1_i1:87-440(-)
MERKLIIPWDEDACRGYSGGPVWVMEGKHAYLVGIVISGRDCARGNYRGIYTRVKSHLAWIFKHTTGKRTYTAVHKPGIMQSNKKYPSIVVPPRKFNVKPTCTKIRKTNKEKSEKYK